MSDSQDPEKDVVADLVTLVRFGYLVRGSSVRAPISDLTARIGLVNEPNLRELLLTILQAKDIASAIKAVKERTALDTE